MSVVSQTVDSMSQRRFAPAAEFTRRLGWAGLIAAVVVLAGVVLAPERTWPGVLIVAVYLVGLPIGAMIFLSTQAVASGGWHVCFKRIPESIASTIPYAALALLVTLAAGMGTLYEWSHADVMANDAILAGKAGWLNVPFFLTRAVLLLAVWFGFVAAMLRVSRRQDSDRTAKGNRRTVVLSATFLVVLAITFSIASWDWLMSLEAHWFSTVFAAYHFTGAFVSGLAMTTVAAIVLRRRGSLRGIVTDAHLQDMGKLLLGLSSFWAYLWLCQYLLIWYGNLPEEVTFYMHRHHGAWAVVSGANVLVGWVVPFLALLPRASKRSEGFLLKAAGLLLVGHWIDLYYSIQPVFQPQAPVLGVWELAPVVLGVALFLWAFRRGLAAAGLVPVGDAYLEESLHHHQ
jgi:hypothetical protein